MACPFFEPQALAGVSSTHGRLPLIDAYRGRCLKHSTEADRGARTCNQGYARGVCEVFPENLPNQAHRYTIVDREGEVLTLLFIREEEHLPADSRVLHYSATAACLVEDGLDPCIAAQAASFCRSYLRKLCATTANI
jgi:hypothetical protein